MFKRVFFIMSLLTVAVLFTTCASPPEIQPEPEVAPTPPPAPKYFSMKPFHVSMQDHMRLSYNNANEIMLGVFVGGRKDPQKGMIYYFSDFSTFDKTTLSWGPVMNVLAEITPHDSEPEIISQRDFKNLLEWDKVGICWDIDEERIRHSYLVEGQKMLLFLDLRYDEANNRSQRILIDVYPSTQTCAAKSVFDLMVRDLVIDNLP